MGQAIQGAVFAAAIVSGILSFIGLPLAADGKPRLGLSCFAGFGILTGFLIGLGASL